MKRLSISAIQLRPLFSVVVVQASLSFLSSFLNYVLVVATLPLHTSAIITPNQSKMAARLLRVTDR